MAAARPCVASDIGGISDIIKDEVNGLLAPVGNSRAIGDAISRLLNDKILSGRLGQKGREFVKENISLSLMAKMMNKLYKGLISAKV